MTRIRTAAASLAVFAALLSTTVEARGVIRATGPNGASTAAAGPRGAAVRARGTVRNSDGSVTHASGGAFAGYNGSRGARASSTTVSPDGSVSRQGEAGASGPRGSVYSQGGFTRSSDGTWSGSRSSSATNAQTGNSYSGTTQIDPATGKPVHTGTCSDAYGNTIPCR
ncbi:hypothetical protein B2G71_20615 [Novosphingobium sp. PC22D]|uniref:hypothetical protein n=1 Tax=Novosphingobium sp. PC22D TaxID=1962403 RepID=UPI000BF08144|nr:hypothetical protein [Novosphingobium sp. PC22D]PEQ10723.1 hypothetical protein B2G71_20615 [Novosphingobium sp. PC22D]